MRLKSFLCSSGLGRSTQGVVWTDLQDSLWHIESVVHPLQWQQPGPCEFLFSTLCIFCIHHQHLVLKLTESIRLHFPGTPKSREATPLAPKDVWVCGSRCREMSVWVCSGWSLQTAGSSSLYTFLLGPNHWPENELQGMQRSAFQLKRHFAQKLEGHISIVYPLVSTVLSHHLNIPDKAKKPHFFLGIIYLTENYPMCLAVYPNNFAFKVENSSPPSHLFILPC